ncbi:MAG: SANT/Myb domain-containing protein [Bacteroidales bacterium]|nr:SANT/Myb domain-containing protein [Bacteroidales bacterium]
MSLNRKTCFLPQDQFDKIKSQYAKFNDPWQVDEIEELKSMSADGVPLNEISTQLQRTASSIRMKLKSLGLYTPRDVPRPWTPEDESELIKMYSDGAPFQEIASHFDRTEKAVISRLVKLRMDLFNNQPPAL